MVEVYYRPKRTTLDPECVAYDVDTIKDAVLLFDKEFGDGYKIVQTRNPVFEAKRKFRSALHEYYKTGSSSAAEVAGQELWEISGMSREEIVQYELEVLRRFEKEEVNT